jgi:hypothetical protein
MSLNRLEMRWAMFFANLGLSYAYRFRGGVTFALPELGYLIEVTEKKPPRGEWDALRSRAPKGGRFYIFHGEAPYAPNPGPSASLSEEGWIWEDGAIAYVRESWDEEHFWCECPICGAIGIEFEGRGHRLPCACPKPDDKGHSRDAHRLMAAYNSSQYGFHVPPTESATKTPPGYVYFIRAGQSGPIKIGWSKDVGGRLSQLQTGNAERLTVLVSVPTTPDLERRLHDLLARHRRPGGEWFDPAPEILTLIDYLRLVYR